MTTGLRFQANAGQQPVIQSNLQLLLIDAATGQIQRDQWIVDSNVVSLFYVKCFNDATLEMLNDLDLASWGHLAHCDNDLIEFSVMRPEPKQRKQHHDNDCHRW